MDIILCFVFGFYIIFAWISSLAVYISANFEVGIFSWKEIFNLIFAHEIVIYNEIKETLNKVGVAIIMTLWTAICLPINIVVLVFALLSEIIRCIVIVFLKLFRKRKCNYNFKVGDKVCVDDWFYGMIVDIDGETAWCEFETFGGGGTLCFELKDLKLS